jgi:hypothetical protein
MTWGRGRALATTLLLCAADFGSSGRPSNSADTDSAGSSSSTWQYFCFDSEAKFAAVAQKAVFSILPNPDGSIPNREANAPQQAPEEEEEERETPAKSAERAEDADPGNEAVSPLRTATFKLKPLRGTCYFMRVGYWTYEVCPFTSVRQYHSESGGGRSADVHDEFSLGQHIDTRDEYDKQQNTYTQVNHPLCRPPPHHSRACTPTRTAE